MIDQCDPSIASWTSGGDSFTIKDINTFEQEALPKYFNHGKLSSFIRQLNFYGFQKMRSDSDLQVHTKSVRFQHEYFRKDHPELLHKIRRYTASASKVSDSPKPIDDQMEHQITVLQNQIQALETQMDGKLQEAVRAVEATYMPRIKNLEAAYESVLAILIQQQTQDVSKSLTNAMQQHRAHIADFNPSDLLFTR